MERVPLQLQHTITVITREEQDKAQFDWMRKHTRGHSNRMTSPMSGKNRAQRNRLRSAFGNFRHAAYDRFGSMLWY